MDRPRRLRRPWVWVLLLLLASSTARASQVRPLNLEEMAERAGRIFLGTLVERQPENDPALGFETTALTFQVVRGVKGERAGRVTVRVAGQLRDGGAALPDLRPGQRVVLFLYPESRLGLTSPVGFGQGVFVVARDKSDRELAVNAFANRQLFQRLSPAAQARLGPDGTIASRPALGVDELLDAAARLQRR